MCCIYLQHHRHHNHQRFDLKRFFFNKLQFSKIEWNSHAVAWNTFCFFSLRRNIFHFKRSTCFLLFDKISILFSFICVFSSFFWFSALFIVLWKIYNDRKCTEQNYHVKPFWILKTFHLSLWREVYAYNSDPKKSQKQNEPVGKKYNFFGCWVKSMCTHNQTRWNWLSDRLQKKRNRSWYGMESKAAQINVENWHFIDIYRITFSQPFTLLIFLFFSTFK